VLACLIFNVADEKLQGIQEFKEEPPFKTGETHGTCQRFGLDIEDSSGS